MTPDQMITTRLIVSVGSLQPFTNQALRKVLLHRIPLSGDMQPSHWDMRGLFPFLYGSGGYEVDLRAGAKVC